MPQQQNVTLPTKADATFVSASGHTVSIESFSIGTNPVVWFVTIRTNTAQVVHQSLLSTQEEAQQLYHALDLITAKATKP